MCVHDLLYDRIVGKPDVRIVTFRGQGGRISHGLRLRGGLAPPAANLYTCRCIGGYGVYQIGIGVVGVLNLDGIANRGQLAVITDFAIARPGQAIQLFPRCRHRHRVQTMDAGNKNFIQPAYALRQHDQCLTEPRQRRYRPPELKLFPRQGTV